MIYSEFYDLVCLSAEIANDEPITLVSVVRNELYFLPACFQHYRDLGVERFAVVDDQSDFMG